MSNSKATTIIRSTIRSTTRWTWTTNTSLGSSSTDPVILSKRPSLSLISSGKRSCLWMSEWPETPSLIPNLATVSLFHWHVGSILGFWSSPDCYWRLERTSCRTGWDWLVCCRIRRCLPGGEWGPDCRCRWIAGCLWLLGRIRMRSELCCGRGRRRVTPGWALPPYWRVDSCGRKDFQAYHPVRRGHVGVACCPCRYCSSSSSSRSQRRGYWPIRACGRSRDVCRDYYHWRSSYFQAAWPVRPAGVPCRGFVGGLAPFGLVGVRVRTCQTGWGGRDWLCGRGCFECPASIIFIYRLKFYGRLN